MQQPNTIQNNQFFFFFVGGSCGSFVNAIFKYYIGNYNNSEYQNYATDSKDGSCHHMNRSMPWTHWLDQIDRSKKLVVIDFDPDDKSTMIHMTVHKVVKYQCQANPDYLVNTWGAIFSGVTELHDAEKIFLENPDLLIFSDWKNQIQSLQPAMSIKFKEILFGDINGKIADFFKIDPIPQINNFIFDYRVANKKYIHY
jgi:hypothetical protein